MGWLLVGVLSPCGGYHVCVCVCVCVCVRERERRERERESEKREVMGSMPTTSTCTQHTMLFLITSCLFIILIICHAMP